MNWFEGLNKVTSSIEEQLEDEIDHEELGKLLGYSTYHLQRVFLMMTGVSIAEYIRRRRFAAHELINESSNVTEAAYKYGYSSPTSFSRAFKAMHGITPKDVKKEGVVLKAYPPLSFEVSVKGAKTMDYRIVHMEMFKVIGKLLHTTMENGDSYHELPAFWEQIQQSGEIPTILSFMDRQPMGMLGVSDYNPALDQSEFDYYIGVSTSQPTPEGFSEINIPACTWAVFPHRLGAPEDVQQFQTQIVMDWLLTSGYQFAAGPDIEVYGEARDMETWIPVARM